MSPVVCNIAVENNTTDHEEPVFDSAEDSGGDPLSSLALHDKRLISDSPSLRLSNGNSQLLQSVDSPVIPLFSCLTIPTYVCADRSVS